MQRIAAAAAVVTFRICRCMLIQILKIDLELIPLRLTVYSSIRKCLILFFSSESIIIIITKSCEIRIYLDHNFQLIAVASMSGHNGKCVGFCFVWHIKCA